jgi:actin-related protein 10
MYPLLRTTPRAGSRLTIYLRSLILEFGTYHPPFASLAGSVNSAPRPTRVPPEILTDALIEDIKTSCCFVGSPLDQAILHEPGTFDESPRREDRMDVDIEAPLSHGQSLHVNPPSGRRSGTQSGTQSGIQSGAHTPSRVQDSWAAQYERQSNATDFLIPVTPPPTVTGTGRGNIRIPGWIRERAADYLFSGGDVDEPSVAEVILQTLLKVGLASVLKFVKGDRI